MLKPQLTVGWYSEVGPLGSNWVKMRSRGCSSPDGISALIRRPESCSLVLACKQALSPSRSLFPSLSSSLLFDLSLSLPLSFPFSPAIPRPFCLLLPFPLPPSLSLFVCPPLLPAQMREMSFCCSSHPIYVFCYGKSAKSEGNECRSSQQFGALNS